MIEKLSVEIPVIEDVDVLVCGGGPAGIASALAAARQGVKTMLIESQGCLGGVGTNCLVGIWLGSYSRDGKFPVIGGVFSEIVERLVADNAAISAQNDLSSGTSRLGYASWHGRTVPFEFEPCKRILEQILLEAKVNVRYFTNAVTPQMENDCIKGVFIHSKNGIEFIRTATVIDATGDADVAYLAGAPTVKGRKKDGFTSPTGLIFVLDNVDENKFEDYCHKTGDVRLKNIISQLKEQKCWPFIFEGVVCCRMISQGRFFINALLQLDIDGTRAEDLTRGIIEGRQQAQVLFDIMRQHVPGFSKARLIQTSPVLGVRDTRRIIGQSTVTVDDISQGRQYPDTIALSGYQWDMADPKTTKQQMKGVEIIRPYTEIPYSALVPQKIKNLIVAGRSISCEWEALGVLRIMPACFAMGQAVGTAARQVVAKKISFKDININKLRNALRQEGAILNN